MVTTSRSLTEDGHVRKLVMTDGTYNLRMMLTSISGRANNTTDL